MRIIIPENTYRPQSSIYRWPPIDNLVTKFTTTNIMNNKFHRAKILLQAAALLAFAVQMTLAVRYYVSGPSMVSTDVKALASMEEPLQITVCKIDQFNFTAAEKHGYLKEGNYYGGETDNSTFLSWTGRNGTLTANETRDSIFNSGADKIGSKDPSAGSMKTVLPLGQCKYFEGPLGSLLYSNAHWQNFFIVYIYDKESTYEIFISDPGMAPRFQLAKPLITGDRIIVKPTEMTRIHYYNIFLHEKKLNLNDGSCTNYPDQDGHQNFAECVEEENARKLLPVLGCNPPWMLNVKSCAKKLAKNTTIIAMASWLSLLHETSKTGYHYESKMCLKPCKQIFVRIKASKDSTINVSGYVHKINLFFDRSVQMENIVPAYDWTSLLVEMGSSLGLWLGLSVTGLFDILVLILGKFTNFMKNSRPLKIST